MHQNSAIFAKRRIFIGVFAVFALATMLCAGRAAAQDSQGPQAGATPSDQSSPAPKALPRAQIGGHPSLAGAWTLNKDQSDDPRAKMREAMGNSGGQGGGGGRGEMGGGGQRGGGGMGGGRGQGAGGAMNEFSQLTIEQTASSAKVTGSSGRVLAVYSNGDASKSNSSNPADSEEENAPAAAQWKGDQLVAVTQGRRGGSTTRTYELSPDGTQLYVTTKMDNPRFQEPLTFRFVYDPAQTK